MLERLNPGLRIASYVLAAVVLWQLARLALPKHRALASFQKAEITFNPTALWTNASPSLPEAASAQIEKIKNSQILGMIMRPPPMAVLGIAGRDVLLRGPNGQTGLLREGESLGNVKLLQIGTNRVLVEENGQPRELLLFQGFGSDSLMPKPPKPEQNSEITRQP